jgi:hypothetical protein
LVTSPESSRRNHSSNHWSSWRSYMPVRAETHMGDELEISYALAALATLVTFPDILPPPSCSWFYPSSLKADKTGKWLTRFPMPRCNLSCGFWEK